MRFVKCMISLGQFYVKCSLSAEGTGIWEKSVPVSYTHLDVYKRQSLFFPDLQQAVPGYVITEHFRQVRPV